MKPVLWLAHSDCHWCPREDDSICQYECHPGQECVDKPAGHCEH